MATRHQQHQLLQSDSKNLIFDSREQKPRRDEPLIAPNNNHRLYAANNSSRSAMPSSLSPLSLHSTSLTATTTTTETTSSASNSPTNNYEDDEDYDGMNDDESSFKRHSTSKNIASSPRTPLSPKSSPILIKYNYYDYNGLRQEQPNQDMNYNHQQNGGVNSGRIHRQLSPTFKQNLDEIVRSQTAASQSTLANNQNHHLQSGKNRTTSINHQQSSPSNSSLSSPSPISPSSSANQQQQQQQQQLMSTMSILARRYKSSSYEQRCLRCQKLVYQMDKVGPLKDFTFFHQNCFKCLECGTKLTLRTYFNNQQNSSIDLEVYCHRHCPKTPAGRLDNQSVGIRAALNAPKVFENQQQQQPNGDHHHHLHNFRAQNNYSPQMFQQQMKLSPQQQQQQQQPPAPSNPSMIDSSALYIQHAVQQTKLQSIYKQSQVDKKISKFLEKRLEYLEPRQKLLEMRHREEEEQLFKAFELKWSQEENCISEQIRLEWQQELGKLLEKYKRQLSSIANNIVPLPTQTNNHSQQQQLKQQQQQHRNGNNETEQQMIEFERMNLEKTMTIKLDRKKETLKRKLREFERQATAELVERQSREMLTLISRKLEEFKEEQKRKIGSDFLEQFEAIESLANQLGASLQLDHHEQQQQQQKKGQLEGEQAKHNNNNNNNGHQKSRTTNQQQSNNSDNLLAAPSKLTSSSPPPKAPETSKMQLYNSEQADEVFKEIDQLAINVAREDQQTFTDLVHHLTRNCLSDVEKVRAIFRWITVKNLNTMQFDSTVKPDTPMGLLRGIKQGSESYHVLFKRLCSYAGLHCVVIKGYSKSAGYQPGVRFEGSRFRNSWNAVYVAGAWRFVQCNWGARHLVSVAVMQDNKNNNSSSASSTGSKAAKQPRPQAVPTTTTTTPINGGRSAQQQQQQPVNSRHHHHGSASALQPPNLGRRGLSAISHQNNGGYTSNESTLTSGGIVVPPPPPPMESLSAANGHLLRIISASSSSSSSAPSSCLSSSSLFAAPGGGTPSPTSQHKHSHQHSDHHHHHHQQHQATRHQQRKPTTNGNELLLQNSSTNNGISQQQQRTNNSNNNNDSLRYEYDDHYFLTDPDEFIYEFYPLASEWQLLKTRPIELNEFEQLPFVRSLFFKYGLYFPQTDIRSVLYTDSSGATTIKIGMPTHMVPSLIFHCNLKYFNTDLEHHDGVSLKRFVMQSVESGTCDGPNGQILLSNIVSFRVHLPENGSYILDIFANSTTPMQYITGEPMKFKSVCKFKIIAKNLKTVMIPLPDCASGEYGPMKATRLFGLIPITHESALIVVQNEKRFLEIQFRMTRPLLDFMASLHKNSMDERQLSKLIKIFIDGDIVFITIKFLEDGQYGLDIYTRDSTQQQQQMVAINSHPHSSTADIVGHQSAAPPTLNNEGEQQQQVAKKQLLTHCCKYLINVRGASISTTTRINV